MNLQTVFEQYDKPQRKRVTHLSDNSTNKLLLCHIQKISQFLLRMTSDLIYLIIYRNAQNVFTLGFLPSITATKVAMYVSRRGPKVSQVSIFRNKYKPILIRLNVEDDKNVTLLDDPKFWQDGVICRPWMTNNQYRTGGGNSSRRRSNQAVDHSRERRATQP